MDETKLVKIGEAAEMLGISIDTIRRWDKAGKLSSTRDGKNRRLFSVSELKALKEAKPLTISEAAEKLGVSATTLRRAEKEGLISPSRNEKGERRYTAEHLLSYQSPPPVVESLENSVPLTFIGKPEQLQNSRERFNRPMFSFDRWISGMNEIDLGTKTAMAAGAIFLVMMFVIGFAGLMLLNAEKNTVARKTIQKQPLVATSTQKFSLNKVAGSLAHDLIASMLGVRQKSSQYTAQLTQGSFGVLGSIDSRDNRQVLAALNSLEDNIVFNIPTLNNQKAIFGESVVIQGLLTAPNVIYSLTAGDNITITGTQDLTISAKASGVTTLQSKTGALSLEAGGGISIDGLKISNSDKGSSQSVFKNIAVSGADTIVADGNDDTLTFVAGTGVAITTSASGDSITFTGTADPGWTDDGTTVRLSTISDLVGIGTTGPTAKVDILRTTEQLRLAYDSSNYSSFTVSSGGNLTIAPSGGTLAVTGALTTSGAVTLGDATGDNITFTGRIANGTSIIPNTDLGSDLGSVTNRFNNLWVANINSNSSQSFSGQTTFSYAPTDTTIAQASVIINPTTSAANGQLLGLGIAGFQRSLIDEDGDMVLGYNNLTSAPATDYPLDIYGHSGTRVAYIDTSGNMTINGTLSSGASTFSSNITMADDTWIGLGSAAGRLEFDNQATDELNILNANVGIGTSTPGSALDVSGTVTATDIVCTDCLDFAEFEDTLDLDAALILNQGTNTWTQNFTGIATTGFTYNADSLTTGIGELMSYDALSSGTGLSITSTSTALSSGKLLSLDWSPGSATTATSGSSLLTLNIGANGIISNIFDVQDASSSVFSVGQSQIISALPHSFTAAGDISAAYDLIFTNQTSGNIKSLGPLAIEAGESFESNYLTLRTFNSGALVFDLAGGATFAQAQAWDLANSSTTALNIESGLLDLDTTNSRVGISDTSPDAKLDIDSTSTTGADFLITNTGVAVSGTIAGITANSLTTGDLLTLSATGMTTGSLLVGTGSSSVGVTDHFVKLTADVGSAAALIYGAPDFSGAGVTAYGLNITATDATSSANTDYGVYSSLAMTGNAAKIGYGYYDTVTSSSTTADTLYGGYSTTSVTGIITSGTRSVYGYYSNPTAGAESTGGTTNVYGGYYKADADVGVGGTVNGYGLYVANGAYDTDGTSTQYGLYIEDVSGADTNVDLAFTGSPLVTIGNTGTLTLTDGTNTLFSIADDTAEGDVTVTGDLVVNGATSADITTATTTATVFNTTATTLSVGGAATTFNLGTTDSVTRTINLGTGTGADSINIGTGATTADTLNFGNTGVATTFNFDTGAATVDAFDVALNSLTTAIGFDIDANALTSGTVFDTTSTSTALTSGDLMSLYWNPGSAATATSGSSILTLNVGSNGIIDTIFNVQDAGSSVFSVGQSQIVSALPHSFTAAGDVNIAYDLQFTNQTASYIKSNAPLYLEAGESFESNDLTLRTFNSGDLVLDLAGGATFAQAQAWDLANSSTTSLNIESGLLDFDTTNSFLGVSDTSPDAKLDIDSSSTTGADFLITNTGISASGTIAGITANSLTTGDVLTLNATGMTTGSLLVGTGSTSVGVTDHFVKLTADVGSAAALIYGAPDFSGAGVTGYGLNITATDATGSANTDYGVYSSLALSGNAAKVGYGAASTVTSSSTTADTLYGLYATTTVTGIMAGAGTRSIYGLYANPTAGAESTAGTTNVYGGYMKADADVGVGGTVNGYGLYIANGTYDTDGTSTQYGLYVESPTGADNNYAAIFAGGNVGIGEAVPTDTLHVAGQGYFTTGVHIGADADANLFDDASNGAGSTTMYIGNASINVTASDRRLKDNIVDSELNALDLLGRLDVKDFDWKEGTKWAGRGRATGLIAQEVYEILPQVVDRPADGTSIWSIEYHHLVPYAIKGIQELDKNQLALGMKLDEVGEIQTGQGSVLGENSQILNQVQDDIAIGQDDMVGVQDDMVGVQDDIKGQQEKIDSIVSENQSILERLTSIESVIARSDPSVIASDSAAISSDDTLSDSGIASAEAVLGAMDNLDNVNCDSETCTVPNDLLVAGGSNLNDLSVTGTANFGLLSISGLNDGKTPGVKGAQTPGVEGEQEPNGAAINSIGTLYLQNEYGSETIDLLGGKVTMTKEGNVTVAGTVTAKEVHTEKLVIANLSEVEGEAISNGIATSSATPRDDSSASIGTATLDAGKTKLTIKTTAVTENSRIFVTPKTLLDYPLVVTAKKAGESFTVEVKRSENTDIKFDWWVIN